jgi:acetylornithine/succinyldiaminopimelate/putrescine aminotransferase
MAKGLASGLPIGAVVCSDKVGATIAQGDLGSTFGGGPVPCAAALATLDVIQRERLMDNAREIGAYLSREAVTAGAVSVQGRGMLLGLRMPRPATEVQQALFSRRILTGTASDSAILRLLPPLSFSRSESDILLGALKEILS